jgi:tellurite methyltransferase
MEPNKLLLKIFSHGKSDGYFLDLGCGQGSDSLFMAEKGFNVVAIDKSLDKIRTLEKYLEGKEIKERISLLCQDIADFDIEKDKYQIINAFNSLQFLLKEKALDVIEKMKNGLENGGYIIISSFTTCDPLYQISDNKYKGFFELGELKSVFSDFKIDFYEEKTIDDIGHLGFPEPHKHCIVKIIAQKLNPSIY